MAKTQDELKELKEEYEKLNEKLKELTDDELKQITGGDSQRSETNEKSKLLENGGQHQR